MASIPWLADVLRAASVQVVEEGDWRNRGVSGSFNPIGVLWHHTAATSSASNPAPALNICINGRSDLQGPLCHALVDYHGVFHLISANRANHAGWCGGSGPIPVGDGNTMLIGWEIDYNGVSQQMTPAQYNASLAATAAVLRRLGRDASYARGHRETSVTGKIDPSFIDLNIMRADVATRMKGRGREGSDGVIVLSSGAIAMYRVGSDGNVWGTSQAVAGGSFSDWQQLSWEGDYVGRPAVIQVSSGAIALYARTRGGLVRGAGQSVAGGAFSGWGQIGGGGVASDPRAVVAADGCIAIYVDATDGYVAGASQSTPGGPFSDWQPIGT